MIWIILALVFLVLSIYLHKSADHLGNTSKTPSQDTNIETKSESYWEKYQRNYPSKAKSITSQINLEFDTMTDNDVREIISSIERMAASFKCDISEIKEQYLKEISKYPEELLPEMIASTSRIANNEEADMFGISPNNTMSSIMVGWLKERHDEFLESDSKVSMAENEDEVEMAENIQENKLYHDGFVFKPQEELEQMTPVDLFRYRCKEAIIQTMIPYRRTNNIGCQSEACKKLMLLANQMSNSTELMETALVFGYGGDFSNIIYEETDMALQSYCGVSIYNVWDYNENNKVFDVDSSLEMYINSNRLMQALAALSNSK